MNEIKITQVDRHNREAVFNAAYEGSYYTILGCGGDLNEWAAKYCELLEEYGIGTPKEFFAFEGADMNEAYGLTGNNAYKDELHCLMFPLDGLADNLAMFKLGMGDRWFDDIVDNNRYYQEQINESEL